MSEVEIGARLFIARVTVRSHLAAACRKLGVRGRVELVRLVLPMLRGQ